MKGKTNLHTPHILLAIVFVSSIVSSAIGLHNYETLSIKPIPLVNFETPNFDLVFQENINLTGRHYLNISDFKDTVSPGDTINASLTQTRDLVRTYLTIFLVNGGNYTEIKISYNELTQMIQNNSNRKIFPDSLSIFNYSLSANGSTIYLVVSKNQKAFEQFLYKNVGTFFVVMGIVFFYFVIILSIGKIDTNKLRLVNAFTLLGCFLLIEGAFTFHFNVFINFVPFITMMLILSSRKNGRP